MHSSSLSHINVGSGSTPDLHNRPSTSGGNVVAGSGTGSNGLNSSGSVLDAITSGRIPYRELVSLYEETAEKLQRVHNEKEEIQRMAQQRQDAFLRTEEKYREDMRLLQHRLSQLGVEDASRMEPLRNLHGNIQDTISSIQEKTAKVLQDQERDLIRAFRARLADVTVELENERKKNESGSAEWVARCRKLTEELEWLRDLTDKLTAENKAVLKDNRRFKRQMKTQEEDREFLIKQLVSVKKENARIRFSLDQIGEANANVNAAANGNAPLLLQRPDTAASGFGSTLSSITGAPMSQVRPALRAGTPLTDSRGNRAGGHTPMGATNGGLSRPTTAKGGMDGGYMSRPHSAMVYPASGARHQSNSRPGTAAGYPSIPGAQDEAAASDWVEKERRYQAMISKLQRQVEDCNARYRALRTNYTNELASRTELQAFVRQCIDDVRMDMAARGRSATLRRAQGAHRAASAGALRSKQSPPPPLDPRSIPLSDFTAQDRINVLEWLMSQDQVIFMLYEKIFPTKVAAAQNVNEELAGLSMGGGGSASSSGFSSPVGSPSRTLSNSHNHTSSSPILPPASRPMTSHANTTITPTKVQRPQTVGMGQKRTKGGNSGGSSSNPSSPFSLLASRSSTGSQYAPPLGQRPLSGYEHVYGSSRIDADEEAGSNHGGGSGSGLTEEERAEDEYQRQQRQLDRQQAGEVDEEEEEYQDEQQEHDNQYEHKEEYEESEQ